MWLTDLARVARRTGYPVAEIAGWRTRGHDGLSGVRGIVCHHTAGASGGGDYPSLRVVRDGRPGLDGPLSQLGLGRSGMIYVIAAGRCWHNAPSTSTYHSNSWSIGIEAENDGRQRWPAVQLDAYEKLCAALCDAYDLPASRVRAHREVNTDKPDPHSIDMGEFRDRVNQIMRGELPMSLSDDDVKRIARAVWETDGIIAAPPNKVEEGNTHWAPESYAYWDYRQNSDTLTRVKALEAQVAEVLALLRQPEEDGA